MAIYSDGFDLLFSSVGCARLLLDDGQLRFGMVCWDGRLLLRCWRYMGLLAICSVLQQFCLPVPLWTLRIYCICWNCPTKQQVLDYTIEFIGILGAYDMNFRKEGKDAQLSPNKSKFLFRKEVKYTIYDNSWFISFSLSAYRDTCAVGLWSPILSFFRVLGNQYVMPQNSFVLTLLEVGFLIH